MKISNNKSFFKRLFFAVLFLNCCSGLFAQTPATVRDSTSTTFSFGKLDTPNPSSIESKYTYDPLTDRYFFNTSVGDFDINYPIILTPKQFQELAMNESLKRYYKDKIDALEGKKEGSEDAKKNLIPDFYVNSKFFETIFGSNTISVVPQGSVEMDLGVMYTKQENPAFSPRNQSNFTFDFDQRISLSLMGQVGTRLQVNANYDTQSTFDFQNLIKLEYDPSLPGLDGTSGGEDSILQKLEVGNVSMPLNSSLITGAQSLFGVKTELQFGKTRVTAVFSEQQSETRSVVSQGGGTMWSKRQGFTLLELLITLVIVVVLVAMGVPAMTELLDRMRTEDAVSRWQADLVYARQAAATYNTIVTVCPVATDNVCAEDWSSGYHIFVDNDGNGTVDEGDEVLHRRSAVDQRDHTLASDGMTVIRFDTEGFTQNSGALVYCPSDVNSELSQGLVIRSTGQTRRAVTELTCEP